jgi:hypothetical protein
MLSSKWVFVKKHKSSISTLEFVETSLPATPMEQVPEPFSEDNGQASNTIGYVVNEWWKFCFA